jgi:hypothetical protein
VALPGCPGARGARRCMRALTLRWLGAGNLAPSRPHAGPRLSRGGTPQDGGSQQAGLPRLAQRATARRSVARAQAVLKQIGQLAKRHLGAHRGLQCPGGNAELAPAPIGASGPRRSVRATRLLELDLLCELLLAVGHAELSLRALINAAANRGRCVRARAHVPVHVRRCVRARR